MTQEQLEIKIYNEYSDKFPDKVKKTKKILWLSRDEVKDLENHFEGFRKSTISEWKRLGIL